MSCDLARAKKRDYDLLLIRFSIDVSQRSKQPCREMSRRQGGCNLPVSHIPPHAYCNPEDFKISLLFPSCESPGRMLYSHILGIAMICVPIICLQLQPEAPMGLNWSRENYRSLCIWAGAFGGILLTRNEASRQFGYKWVAGMLGGGITSAIAFYASLVWLGDVPVGGPNTNIVLIMLCGVPGLIVYAIVKCCSDYTFPESYQSIPTYNPSEGSSTSDSERKSSHPHAMQTLR
jgi:hypothetical protein